MIPVKLALKNFMCYRDNVPPLSFDGIHVACLCGDNGNGKSAILDAITWALWGKARAKSDDELIHVGRTEMEVEFEFASGQDRYRVIRKRTKPSVNRPGHSLLDLQIATGQDFRSIAGNSIRETQQKIIEILRMDYDTFINSAFLLQGRADEFTVKLPSERKEVLARILNLSLYDELEERAKLHARASENRYRELASAIAEIDSELARKGEYETELGEVRQAIAELEADLKKQESGVNALKERKRELDLKKQQAQEVDSRIKQAEAGLRYFERQVAAHCQKIEGYERALASYHEEMAKANAGLAELARVEEKWKEKRGRGEEVSNRIHHLKSTNDQLKQEISELKEKLDLLSTEEENCPLCGTKLGVEGKEKIMASYQAQGKEKADSYRINEGEIAQLEAERKALGQEIGELESKTTSERVRWERRREALDREHAEAENSLPREKEALAQASEALEGQKAAFTADTQRRESIAAELAALPEVEAELTEAQRVYDAFLERQRKGRDKLVELEIRLKDLAIRERSKTEKEKELLRASREKGIYDELAAAFGKKGIQAWIIEEALPEIEEEANRLLSRMTDNRMHVKMEAQRAYKTKKAETLETLDINISDELGLRRYEMYSGGEAFRINFALRIALSRLLARRAGAPLPTLFIDEGFGTQDSGGREKLIEAINSIQDDFEKIIVITHIEELKDAFPVRIDVTKTSEGSMIEVS